MESVWDGQFYETPKTPSESTVLENSERKTPSLLKKMGTMLRKPFSMTRKPSGSPPVKPDGNHGQRITILSIDGGGVRGVILATILQQLEACLQKLDGSDKRIVDYFDLIAGTSTGGLISAMLATPNSEEPTRPMFIASNIIDFYKKYASRIQRSGPLGNNQKRALAAPKYDSQGLEDLLNEYFQEDKHLSGMLMHVIIPSFDIGVKKPVFFSSMKAKHNALENLPLHLVCRATLATPTYFPPVEFTLQDPSKKSMKYNMIDGIVVVNNPTYVAINQAIDDIVRRRRMHSDQVKFEGYGDLLVLSLGTRNQVQNLSTDESHEMDLVDMVFNTSFDMVDYNLNIMFKSQKSSQNYLRITTNGLKDSEVLLGDLSLDNLDKLVKLGTQLLKDRVADRDIETGALVFPSNNETNHNALERFAKSLVEERKARKKPIPAGKTPEFKIPTVLLPYAPAKAKSSDSKFESKLKPNTTERNTTKATSSTHNPPKTIAMEKVVESQVKVEKLADVTFPDHPPQQFFDNSFQTSTHNMDFGYGDAFLMDPIYSGRSNIPKSSESLGNWQGNQSPTTTFSNYPSDNCNSGQGSSTYYESAYQMSYAKTQSTNMSSQLDEDRYRDYFNIFS